MRLLHFADLHLGVERYGGLDPQSGLPSQVVDVLRALDQVVDYAIQEGVDLVLFGGDAYKSREPSQTHQREFARRIRRLTDAGIPIFLLVGNHDLPNAIARATALEIFDTLGVPRVYVGARPGTQLIPTRRVGARHAVPLLQVVALPWPSRSWLLAKDEHRGLTVEQVGQRMEEKLCDIIQREAAALDPALPAVLCAHVAVAGVEAGSEAWMTVGQEPQLLRSTLCPEAFDYVALGHHHSHRILSLSPPMAYCGSLQRVDFAEADDAKGFYTVELDPARPRGQRALGEPQFHPVWARPFVTVAVKPQADDPTPEVLARLRRAPIADAVVRVQLRLTRQQSAHLREGDLRQALAAAHHVAAIQREVVRERRLRLPPGVAPQGLSPLEALERLYLDDPARSYTPERRKLLMAYAQRLLAGSRGAS